MRGTSALTLLVLASCGSAQSSHETRAPQPAATSGPTCSASEVEETRTLHTRVQSGESGVVPEALAAYAACLGADASGPEAARLSLLEGQLLTYRVEPPRHEEASRAFYRAAMMDRGGEHAHEAARAFLEALGQLPAGAPDPRIEEVLEALPGDDELELLALTEQLRRGELESARAHLESILASPASPFRDVAVELMARALRDARGEGAQLEP